jgi:hypothetical protein
MGRFLNDYECKECGTVTEALVQAKSLADTRVKQIGCTNCGKVTEHVKCLGGTKSRYFYHDPRF